MSAHVTITLPDGATRDYDRGVTGAEVAADISKSLGKSALACRIDGTLSDLSRPIEQNADLAIVTGKDEAEALEIANDTLYGLGSGVWTRDINRAYRMGRGIQAGRVWTNCYHLYPAGAAFGGYKKSGFGRENHKMMLDHYQQTKNMLVSYSPKALGFF